MTQILFNSQQSNASGEKCADCTARQIAADKEYDKCLGPDPDSVPNGQKWRDCDKAHPLPNCDDCGLYNISILWHAGLTLP